MASGASGKIVLASPELPPGRTLTVSDSGEVAISATGDSPAVRLDRTWAIEVLDSPIATVVNVTRGITYPPGSYSSTSQGATRWAHVMLQASHGDIIEVSPGAIQQLGEARGSYFQGLDSCILPIWKVCTLRNMAGRGRWSMYPNDDLRTSNLCGINIFSPAEIDGRRGEFVIEGFELDNWGNRADSSGIKVRSNYVAVRDWVDYHNSVTLRNFKIGKRPFERSASGLAGSAQTWIIENGHVYDTADGVNAAPGNDHNAYISGQNLFMRGVRLNRTRSAEFPFRQGNTADGHHAKLTFNYATIEGCVFDCGPEGDSSIQIQMKGGGNLVVRGCLLIAGRYSQTATGSIVFEKEVNNFGSWTYGLAGHSVLVERNVFINHRAYAPPNDRRAMVYFRPPGHSQEVTGVSSVIVRDNIGMSTVPSSIWIANDPTGGAAWVARGNTERPYSTNEAAFSNRELLAYRDALGAPAASRGAQTIPSFVWPHGLRDVTRSTQGLG